MEMASATNSDTPQLAYIILDTHNGFWNSKTLDVGDDHVLVQAQKHVCCIVST